MGSERNLTAALALSIAVISNPAMAAKKPVLTPLEIQSIQSHEFEASKDMTFAAVMTVIQDLGYIVQSADLHTGFITARSLVEEKTSLLDALGGIDVSGSTSLTAFMIRLPNGSTRVRMNFVSSKSETVKDKVEHKDVLILDPAPYNNAWDKIDEALFVLESMSASPTPAKTDPATAKPKAQ